MDAKKPFYFTHIYDLFMDDKGYFSFTGFTPPLLVITYTAGMLFSEVAF